MSKLEGLDDACEDYGQIAVYRGTAPHLPSLFVLDDHHYFEIGRPERVCANTAQMLSDTRLKEHFKVIGNKTVHYGAYPCGGTMAYEQYQGRTDGGGCC